MVIEGKQDGAINMLDIMEVAKAFNSTVGDSRYNRDADINKDSAVNMADVMIVAKHFNATSKDYEQTRGEYDEESNRIRFDDFFTAWDSIGVLCR